MLITPLGSKRCSTVTIGRDSAPSGSTHNECAQGCIDIAEVRFRHLVPCWIIGGDTDIWVRLTANAACHLDRRVQPADPSQRRWPSTDPKMVRVARL